MMAEKHQQPKESSSKVGIVPVLLAVELAFCKHLLTGPFRGENGAATYRQDVLYSATRQLLGRLSTAQVQFAPGTSKTYKWVAKRNHATENTVDLGAGAQGHWIGGKHAKNVMLYFHGGGFYGPSTLSHWKYQFALQKEMCKQGHDFSIFALSYTLSPGAVYPTQLKQAASALKHLLEVEQRDPSTILLAGDSAGGNLATELLFHIALPHPSVPKIILSHPLHAALLISPWVSFETEGSSFTRNYRSDYLTVQALNRASHAYVAPGSSYDNYSQPISAPAEWWRDVADRAVGQMMIWAGDGEVLIDGIRIFARTVKSGFDQADEGRENGGIGDRFRFVVSPKHAHEEMIMNYLPLMKPGGHGAQEIERWLSSVLGQAD